MTLLVGVLGACQPTPSLVIGEIDDAVIRLALSSAPAAARVELTNVGERSCDLVPMLTAVRPDSLPVSGGRVTMSLSGEQDEVAPMEAYVELNGQAVDRLDGTLDEHGWVTRVGPGDTVMLDVGLKGVPEREARLLVCNGPGEYEAGRYAVLAFDR